MKKLRHTGLAPLLLLSLGALGVVYGDIGTSPLYAVNEIFFGHAHLERNFFDVIGAISLVLWCLTMIVTVKYVIFVLRADADGEGGVFALYSILKHLKNKFAVVIVGLLVLAAGLLYGDGIITPAISVTSAVEGIKIITGSFEPYIIPITLSILTILFVFQKFGTHKVGNIFGPIIIVWFFSIAILGLNQIIRHPGILVALNPLYAIRFAFSLPLKELMYVMGSVILVVTGGEAMYADMGHFGRKPIRFSWFSLVYPALILNYLGQGGLLLSNTAIKGESIFYSMVPTWAMIPMVIIATLATIIASQALISGAFSLTAQAVSLGLFPKLTIKHTNQGHHGQIYIPAVNWMLYIGCIALVLIFKSSTKIAAAYGLAVSGVMFLTTLGMIIIANYLWCWSKFKTALIFAPLALIELLFLSSNLLKITQGGWIPLLIAFIIFFFIKIWKNGKEKSETVIASIKNCSISDLVKIKKEKSIELALPSVFMTPNLITDINSAVPPLYQVYYQRYGIIPKFLIFLTVQILKDPYAKKNRIDINTLYHDNKSGSITSIQVNFGFMENPDVEKIVNQIIKSKKIVGLDDKHEWLFHITKEHYFLGNKQSKIKKIGYAVYKFIANNINHSDQFFHLGEKYQVTVEPLKVILD
ncbi:MAG: KUP/HAK/KT family potassium transporter [bacterium]